MTVGNPEKTYIVPEFLGILLFSSFFVLFDWTYASLTIFLLCMMIAASMMIIRQGRLTLRVTFFHIWMITLGLFCLFSAIWAWDVENAITKGKTVFSMFLCYSLAYLCYQEYDSVDSLLKAVLWGGNTVMMIIIGTYGIHGILRLLEYDDRLSEQFYLNSNVVGVLCAMSIVVNLYYILKDKRLHWWNLFLVLGVIMVSATGSRQALAIMAGGVVLFCFLAALRGKTPAEIIGLVAIGIALIILMLILFSKIPAFSGIYKRILSLFSAVTGIGKTDRSATTRLALIDVGVEQFKRTPLLGVGMGSGHLVAWKYLNRYYYLHNNYAEILADGGSIGFAIYYAIYAYVILGFIRFRRYGTLETILCFTLVIMLLVEDYASVTYYAKETYFYLMICVLEVEKLRRACREAIPKIPILQTVTVEEL